ncbi:MAG: spore coat associated protein CotJA [Ruminiclostridium sp.]|nr:spore coat associated protein CotJA [Ruminiclostridium sp.]MBQ8825463.1 spore coat associated protein CotJA [Oscillospiraceae bacterium]
MNRQEMINMCNPDAYNARVGYAYIPVQRIGKVYPPAKALQQGTIFPELDIGLNEYTRGIWDGK